VFAAAHCPPQIADPAEIRRSCAAPAAPDPATPANTAFVLHFLWAAIRNFVDCAE